jgi:hypothetical protein
MWFLPLTGTIDTENCETNDIRRNIRNMENDMIKLNMLLHKEKGTEYGLQQGNILMENDFIGNLKVSQLHLQHFFRKTYGIQNYFHYTLTA